MHSRGWPAGCSRHVLLPLPEAVTAPCSSGVDSVDGWGGGRMRPRRVKCEMKSTAARRGQRRRLGLGTGSPNSLLRPPARPAAFCRSAGHAYCQSHTEVSCPRWQWQAGKASNRDFSLEEVQCYQVAARMQGTDADANTV